MTPPTTRSQSSWQNSVNLLEDLGEGAFGCVIKCQDKITHEFYAIKMIDYCDSQCIKYANRELKIHTMLSFSSSNSKSTTKSTTRRGKAKNKKWKKKGKENNNNFKGADESYHDEYSDDPLLSSGEGIVKLYGHYFVSKPYDTLCLVMEYCPENLTRYIKKQPLKRLDEVVSGNIMKDVTRTLMYIHERGIMHRDIKPSNILMTKEGKPKLADFGISTSTTYRGCGGKDNDGRGGGAISTTTSTTTKKSKKKPPRRTIIGTRGYTAPEIENQLYATDKEEEEVQEDDKINNGNNNNKTPNDEEEGVDSLTKSFRNLSCTPSAISMGSSPPPSARKEIKTIDVDQDHYFESEYYGDGEDDDDFFNFPMGDYYNEKVDLWSLGATLYTMLTGIFPEEYESISTTARSRRPSSSSSYSDDFDRNNGLCLDGAMEHYDSDGDNDSYCYGSKINKDTGFQFDIPNFVSEHGQDLIRGLLKENPEDRIPLQDVLRHPWMMTMLPKAKTEPK